ncbi:MAG: methylamine utilization protein [Chthoniobacterales bacterium]
MNRLAAVIIFGLFGVCQQSSAGSLSVAVKNANGAAVSDAVVYAEGANSGSAKRQAIIDQRDKQFVPYVTAVQVGTSILFPNKDNIRHHVYSFSSAKKFELPLYAGVPADPVVFDKVGFVTLGCNIHDWMIAYVAVLPTPYFQVTGSEGRALLKDLPAGHYKIEVWQPLLKGSPEKFAQNVDLASGGTKELVFTVDLKPDFRTKRAPGLSNGGYP